MEQFLLSKGKDRKLLHVEHRCSRTYRVFRINHDNTVIAKLFFGLCYYCSSRSNANGADLNRDYTTPDAVENPDVWEKYHREGITRYSSSLTAEAVGQQYLKVIERCLPNAAV